MRSDRQRWPQALLFDMDGLTVDTEPVWFEAETAIARARGASWFEADHLSCVGGPVERMASLLAERIDQEAEWPEIAEEVIGEVVRLLPGRLLIQPGVAALIAEAKAANVPIALVSGSPRTIVDAVVSSLPFEYAAVVSSGDVSASKPAPEPYLKAAAELGVAIEHCLALEDSPTGVASALAAGARVVVVPSVPVAPAERQIELASLEGITLGMIREHFDRHR